MNFAAINPALMNLDMDNRIGINYGSYIAGSNLGSINYVNFAAINPAFMHPTCFIRPMWPLIISGSGLAIHISRPKH